jgi:L-ascorbate metabolism protein UlaG (beta-lactamase superfamily)
MDIQFYGANCIVIAGKQVRLVIDDNLAELGAKSVTKEGDIALFTGPHGSPAQSVKLTVDRPGEYEVSGVSIFGISAQAHIDQEDKHSATMYKIILEDFNVLITGHIFPELTGAQLETIGMIDVMFVPVGNSGYTLDGIGALKLVKKIEPKLVVPTHYEDAELTFPVPQQPLEQALKALAMEPKETVPKLRLKPGDLTDLTQLLILERS